jgi:hypothetical protein
MKLTESQMLDARLALRERHWRTIHAPILALDRELERIEEEKSEIGRLGWEVREGGSHEARARAENELERARRRQLARRGGDPVPLRLADELRELQRRQLFGIVRAGGY